MPPSVITLTSKPRATVKLLVAVTSGFVYGISRMVVSIWSIFIVRHLNPRNNSPKLGSTHILQQKFVQSLGRFLRAACLRKANASDRSKPKPNIVFKLFLRESSAGLTNVTKVEDFLSWGHFS